MSGEGENKSTSGVLGRIKAAIEEAKTLLIAIGALIAAAGSVYTVAKTYLWPSSPPPSSASAPGPGCYRLDVIPQDTISISSVKSGNISKWFDLLFVNGCQLDLIVRVEFKPVGDGGIVIAPPQTWPAYTIRAGERIAREVVPPNLELLTEKPQVVQILVSIYREDNQELIGKDTCKIQMVG
jgi:hypothetical protein